jgi:hypothetical protein
MTRSLTPWRPPDPYSYSWLLGFYLGDGCIARAGRTYQLRVVLDRAYFFSNQSADIRGLFCEYCEKLGIRWTQSNARNISIAHRKSVALLDAFVGPKR